MAFIFVVWKMVDDHKLFRVGTCCQKFDFSSALIHCRSEFRVIEPNEALYSYIRYNIDIDITIPRHRWELKALTSSDSYIWLDSFDAFICDHSKCRILKLRHRQHWWISALLPIKSFEITKYLSIKHNYEIYFTLNKT
jgi:hypothetical protein